MNNKTYYADLHTHSYWSDGSCSPRGVARRAREHGLQYVSLVDVANIGGWQEFKEACNEYGLKTDPAIEIQSFYNGDTIELLLFGEGILETSFKYFIDSAYHTSEIVGLLYLGYIRSQNIFVSKSVVDNFFKIPQKRTWSLYYINEFLRRARDIPHEKINSLINNAKLRHIDRLDIYNEWLPRTENILHVANKLNIVSCYAHPGVVAERRRKINGTTKKAELQKILDESLILQKIGLCAIEARYPEHSLGEERMFEKHAEANNFLLIGGSGFHGDQDGGHKPWLILGSKGITRKEYEAFLSYRRFC